MKPSSWFRPVQTEIEAWSQEDPASRLLAAVIFIFALFTVWSMAVIQRRTYSALPWADMWDYWVWYLKPHPSLLIKLFALHNEHRIVVARLFFLADHLLFQGRAIFIFISIFVIQFFHAILLWRLAYLAHPHRKALSVFMGSTAFVCLFSAVQYTNFTWSFQIQFVMVYFAVTGAMTSLMVLARTSAVDAAVPRDQGSWFWLCTTIVMAFIATYSMANGLLVWPVLLLAACWFGLARRLKLVLLTGGVGMWVLYLWGYISPPPPHSSIREGFHHLPQSFAFSLCVLGSTLDAFISEVGHVFAVGGDDWRLIWTAAAGLAGFIAAAFLWLTFARDRRMASYADCVILHLLLFLAATAFLIGLGRANFPIKEALQSRYTTVSLLFWYCILFLFTSLIARRSTARSKQSLVRVEFASAVILLLVLVLYQPTQLRYARDAALYVSESEAAIGTPVYDKELWKRIYYDPEAMVPVVRYLQNKHLAVFATKQLGWVGDAITAHYILLPPDRCTGHLDAIEAIASSELPGLRIQGWAWDSRLHKIAKNIVFTDDNGLIIGFGYAGFERPDVQAARPDLVPFGVGWKGYVTGLEHDVISAYMITDSGRSACFVGASELSR